MPKRDPHEEEQDIEEQEDFDADLDADDADEDADDVQMDINRIVNASVARANESINANIAKLSARIDDHDHRITNLEKIAMNVGAMAPKVKQPAAEPATGLDRFLDITLGTTGRVLHAVVDTVAFVGESAIDIVTLGRARVNNK